MLRNVVTRLSVAVHQQISHQFIRTCHILPETFTMANRTVDEKILRKKVMVFSKSYCPFCAKAKNVFARLIAENVLSSDDYEVWEIENEPDCEEIQNYLQKITGARSVPRVFMKGKCMGGGDDVVAADKSGKLVPLLK